MRGEPQGVSSFTAAQVQSFPGSQWGDNVLEGFVHTSGPDGARRGVFALPDVLDSSLGSLRGGMGGVIVGHGWFLSTVDGSVR